MTKAQLRRFLNALAMAKVQTKASSLLPVFCALCSEPIIVGEQYRQSGDRRAHDCCFKKRVSQNG